MAEAAAINASRAPPSLWERASTWVSENKAVAYTIAGTVVVVTSAGAIYYFSTQRPGTPSSPTEKRKSKKERRKEKKAAEEAAKSDAGISLKDEEAGMRQRHVPTESQLRHEPAIAPKAASVEAEEELPDVNESNVESFSKEVHLPP
jgi:import receptor subunit TOM70